MKIVVNRCFGGYSLSPLAVSELAKLNGQNCYHYKQTKYEYTDGVDEYTRLNDQEADDSFLITSTSVDFGKVTNNHTGIWDNYLTSRPEDRLDPKLVEVVEKLGQKANGSCASLEIVEIPDDISWEINEYDGVETVDESHRSW